TPIGDPPLFLGYLSGVPFWWVLKQCQWLWLVTIGVILGIFFILDTIDNGRNGGRHSPEDPGPAVTIQGIHNLLFIAVIVWSVFQPGFFDLIHLMHDKGTKPELLFRLFVCREALMLAAGIGSALFTAAPIYRQNEFNYGPIKEVAILFIGIFSTMVPALQWLNVNARELPIKTPGNFYFASGALSSVLDNAPTYLTFLEAQLGKLDQTKVEQAVAELKRLGGNGAIPDIDKSLDETVQRAVLAAVQYHPNEVRNRELTRQQIEVSFLLGDPRLSLYLIAVSAGSVLFGACTYIGNGPNFMVKSIADAWGVKTPSFIGYILCYTLPVLLPTYVLVWFLFLYH
ncbi:MAG: sodium:proton antiporter, partial [Bacillota bacterium]